MPRILTYNVHRCLGTDGRLSPERIADVIAAYEPDVVALQELDVGRLRSGGVDQAHAIARALGMHVHFHASLRVLEEQYGNAILTHRPSQLVKAEALPGLGEAPEPRAAGGAMGLRPARRHRGAGDQHPSRPSPARAAGPDRYPARPALARPSGMPGAGDRAGGFQRHAAGAGLSAPDRPSLRCAGRGTFAEAQGDLSLAPADAAHRPRLRQPRRSACCGSRPSGRRSPGSPRIICRSWWSSRSFTARGTSPAWSMHRNKRLTASA